MTDEPFQNRQELVHATPFLELWTRPDLLDATVIEEIIYRNAYRVEGRLDGQTVIDCGAHIGVFSAWCASLGARRVLAVEPEPENLLLLSLNARAWPAITIIPQALGATTAVVHMRGESGGAHKIVRSSDHEPDCVEVEQITLETIFGRLQSERIAILKLDMEGGEVDALLACPHEVLARADRIVLETHGPAICPWVERPRVGELCEHLLWTHNIEAAGFLDQLGYIWATHNGTRHR